VFLLRSTFKYGWESTAAFLWTVFIFSLMMAVTVCLSFKGLLGWDWFWLVGACVLLFLERSRIAL